MVFLISGTHAYTINTKPLIEQISTDKPQTRIFHTTNLAELIHKPAIPTEPNPLKTLKYFFYSLINISSAVPSSSNSVFFILYLK